MLGDLERCKFGLTPRVCFLFFLPLLPLPLLLSTEGEVYTWGKGARGRLGRKEEDCGIPKAVQLEESHPFAVTSVACCHGNSLLAVKRNISLITPL